MIEFSGIVVTVWRRRRFFLKSSGKQAFFVLKTRFLYSNLILIMFLIISRNFKIPGIIPEFSKFPENFPDFSEPLQISRKSPGNFPEKNTDMTIGMENQRDSTTVVEKSRNSTISVEKRRDVNIAVEKHRDKEK